MTAGPKQPASESLRSALTDFVASMVRTAPRKSAIAVLLMALVSLTEGIGIAMLLPTLQLAGFDLTHQGVSGRYATRLLTLLTHLGLSDHLPLATVLVLFASVIMLRAALNRLQHIWVYETVLDFVSRTDISVYNAILRAKWTAVVQRRSAELLSLLTTEHERLLLAAYALLTLLSGLLSVVLYSALAFLLSPKLTLLLMCTGVMLAVLLRAKTAAVHRAATVANREMTHLTGEALDHLQNLKAVKTYDAQDRDLDIFVRLVRRASRLYLEIIRRESAANLWFEAASFIILIALLYVALVYRSYPAASVVFLLALCARLMPKLGSVYATAQSVVANLPANSRIQTFVRELEKEAEPLSPDVTFPLQEAIRFRNVSFRFSPDAREILDSVSLRIPARKITAITGPSGAGKSTLADLLMGLFHPQSGAISVDTAELSPASSAAWRKEIGYVAQDTVLFHDTVKANLLWAKPDASEAEMYAALKLVAADFVLDLPAGLETIVGDRGVLLSNGERQRIALARAVLRRPAVLILDEATNNLDSENERRVLEAILRLRGDVTVLLIAHRLSTLQFADLIYVLDGGKIVQSGDFGTILADSNGRFRELFKSGAENISSTSAEI
ncbi:MAG TPA: ABC transporter ATP-binding protein [Candidatus Koribacter sp.]|jgi:ATP-binding cassette subfamily C protein